MILNAVKLTILTIPAAIQAELGSLSRAVMLGTEVETLGEVAGAYGQNRRQYELVGRRPNHLLPLTPESVGLRETCTPVTRGRGMEFDEVSLGVGGSLQGQRRLPQAETSSSCTNFQSS